MKLFSKINGKEVTLTSIKTSVATPTEDSNISSKPSLGELAKKMEQLYKKKSCLRYEFQAGVSGPGFVGSFIPANGYMLNTQPGSMTVNATTGETMIYNGHNWDILSEADSVTFRVNGGGAGGRGITGNLTAVGRSSTTEYWTTTTNANGTAGNNWHHVSIARMPDTVNTYIDGGLTSSVQITPISHEERRRQNEQRQLDSLRRGIQTEDVSF
jgi:hypothetical protein